MARTIHEVTLDELVAGNAEIQALVDERVPQMFGDVDWPFWATAMLARTAAIVDAITALIERGRRADAEVALRTLYVHVTTFCWIAIDPGENVAAWQGGSEAQWHKFGRESVGLYGIDALDYETLGGFGASESLKSIVQLADDVDAYWPEHVAAFRRHPDSDGKELLSFRGTYTAIFRTTSRVAHAEVDSLQANVRQRSGQLLVSMKESSRFGRSGFALPLAAFAFLVYNHHLGWPGEPRTSHLVAALNFDPDQPGDDSPT